MAKTISKAQYETAERLWGEIRREFEYSDEEMFDLVTSEALDSAELAEILGCTKSEARGLLAVAETKYGEIFS